MIIRGKKKVKVETESSLNTYKTGTQLSPPGGLQTECR